MDKAGRTRRAYIVEALLEYMIALLVIDAFLAAILKQVGVSDAVTGIVSSFISFACVAQLFSASLVRRGRSMRKMILILDLINQLMFASLYLTPFPLPHDAADPCGYAFTCGRLRAAIATDIGCLREGWLKAVSGCELVLLESNYDPGMLKAGRYPYALKTRILGTKGHLSNEDAGRAACRLVESGVRSLILGHLSRENNFPELALETVRLALTEAGVKVGTDAELTVASRDHASGMFAVRDGFDLIRRA